ncbi:MAG: signal peptide peptidase SppA [Halobacteriovoraceae bacterium]|nr:signal peptide peptidase SppA [Halobacteriovoraceae bacterium]MCB9093611.1 signal peptide peptidase SppA [Halobacteriovoraceae bacterium]
MKIVSLDFDDEDMIKAGKGPIAVIELEGVILESKKTIELLLDAEEDDSIEAIIMRINSPGGAVGPTQEIYQEITRIDAKKPIYASFGSIAASGGYYIGAACRKIFANAGTLTGSIGVIMQFMDMSDLYQWAKLKPETFKAGKYKDIGSPFRPLTGEERNLMNNMLEVVHRQFISDIAQTRKEKIVGDIIEHAQGQIFSGEEAYKIGLVDELGGLWAAGRSIHKELGLEGKFSLRFIKKKRKFSFRSFIEDMEEETKSFITELGAKKILPMFLFQ